MEVYRIMGLHCKPKKIKKSDLDHNGTYLGKVKARSRQVQVKVKAMSRQSQGKVNARLRQG